MTSSDVQVLSTSLRIMTVRDVNKYVTPQTISHNVAAKNITS